MKWKSALLAGIAVPTLTFALTACSSDDDDDTASTDSAASSSDSTGSGEVTLPDTPAGFELTEDGSHLALGEKGNVVTQNPSGQFQYWEVTVSDLKDLPADTFELEDSGTEIDHFVCVNYELTFLGSADDPDFEKDPTDVETTYPDGSPMLLTARPDMVPVGADGEDQNTIYNANYEDCGISPDDTLPNQLDEVEEGKVYRDADVRFVGKGSREDVGVEPKGGQLYIEYDLKKRLNIEDTIYWEK